ALPISRRVPKKLSEAKRIRCTRKDARLIRSLVVVFNVSFWESQLRIYLSVLLSISNSSSLSAEITIGRTFKLCGATGVMTKLPLPGMIIGPPQLREYAVEPVGVAMIIPSAQYEFKISPFNATLIVIIDDVSWRKTVISFNAKLVSPKIPC